ncbi:hypothetical protein JCGZ_25320 [Jatropha curcas]|uniref:Aminotransferase-like plant mobile domain-containing protein n=1 Tax=Jatropha curcas TaxID=180498 RepID=A0A067LHL4_JATCU|nr:hypothetical protein JCGZ_25320 [Jatropha curcas]
MRYALMERWNDCTHSFILSFGEMTLTPADYTAIIGLGFNGEVAPLDARYQTAALGAELVRTLLGVTTHTRCTAQGYISYELVYRFWAERILTRLAAWRELPADVRPTAPACTREESDQAARSFIFYIISSQLLCTSQNKGDPAVLAYVWTKGSGESNWQFLCPLEVWAYEYRIYPSGPGTDTFADARWIPWYLAHRHHTFSSSEDPHYWRCYLNDRTLADLLLTPWEGDAWAAYPSRAVAEAFTRSRILLHGYWVDRVPAAPPRHMCLLEGMTPEDLLLEYDGSPADVYLTASDYASYFTTRLQARLPEERRRHWTPAYYRAQAEAEVPAGPAGAVLGDVPFPPGMEASDPTLGLGPAIVIPTDLRQAPPPLQLKPEHATHDLEIGRLRRHESRQTSTISRLQLEVNRLRTRLEVEGIPLDFSEDEEDDGDGSSSDDAPPPPPSSTRQAAAGPNRRRC